MSLIFRKMERVVRARPWLRENDPHWFRREVLRRLDEGRPPVAA